MTNLNDDEMSLYEERASTPEGAASLAAGSLGWDIIDLLHRAQETSGVSSALIADRLGVSPGRVSQVMNGSGQIHIATLARFMRALGYELALDLRPAEAGVPEVGARAHRGLRQDMFATDFVTGDGVTTDISIVSSDSKHTPIPLGEPKHVAYSPQGAGGWKVPEFDVESWIARTNEAVDSEEAIGVRRD